MKLYATGAYAQRTIEGFGTLTKYVALALLAYSDYDAEQKTLAHAETLWPASTGWEHQVSICYVDDLMVKSSDQCEGI